MTKKRKTKFIKDKKERRRAREWLKRAFYIGIRKETIRIIISMYVMLEKIDKDIEELSKIGGNRGISPFHILGRKRAHRILQNIIKNIESRFFNNPIIATRNNLY